jgi:beta-lactamase regulating signal transducer with metallopeptidase domain
MACDDFVVAKTGSARSYARSLARLHELRWHAGARLLTPAILGRNSSLADRIESLLRRGRRFSERASLASLGVTALLLALLFTAGGLIPDWIVIAQTSAALPRSFEVA